jgi:hypothetical protein
MRFSLAGIILLLIPVIPATALAQQVTGQVLKVGFGNYYRPDCWTPMLVQLNSQSAESHTYEIDVVQEDLDNDRATFTQAVTLSGNVEGKGNVSSNFWVYFKPRPTGHGLPDGSDASMTLKDLNAALRVYLCEPGGKQITQLPITSTIKSLDLPRGSTDPARSQKLVLYISDGADVSRFPAVPPLTPKGMLEDVITVEADPRNDDLPENILGYEAVDAIVWMDADANFLTQGTHARALSAIDTWVRQGGQLVVTQPDQPFKLAPFAELLPIKPSSAPGAQWSVKLEDRASWDVFKRIIDNRAQGNDWADKGKDKDAITTWTSPVPPMRVARVRPTADAVVEDWIRWDTTDAATGPLTPWLARRGVGLGSVTWVAQNLGDKNLSVGGRRRGWAMIWDHVFGWNNRTQTEDESLLSEGNQQTLRSTWGEGVGSDLGFNLLSGMELSNKTAYLITLAVFFFIAYWIVAGPGTYAVLVGRKRVHLSWFMFGAAALVATALTVLMVRLVLRGPPELRHISIVRQTAGEPAVAWSRFGLYIPRDGEQRVELEGTAPNEVSDVTAFALPPQYLQDTDNQFPAYMEYRVPVRDVTSTDAPMIKFPYRSTLKKIEAKWVGGLAGGGIEVAPGTPTPKAGGPDAARQDYLKGTLVNHTGRNLTDVFLAFNHPRLSNDPMDTLIVQDTWLVYVDKWDNDAKLDIAPLLAKGNDLASEGRHTPVNSSTVYGVIGAPPLPDWVEDFWHAEMSAGHTSNPGKIGRVDLPMMLLFDRIRPMPASDRFKERYEVYRRGGRELNLSGAVNAGKLVVMGEAAGPLPIPVTVEGDGVSGDGTTYFQAVLPIDRSDLAAPPTTQPATQPANAK